MKKNALIITGSQGFIGTSLLNDLISNYDIVGINKLSVNKKKGFFPIKYDISKKIKIKIPKTVKQIVHLAAITDVNYCNLNPQDCIKTNVVGTQNVLDLARQKDIPVLFLSTSHVYGRPNKLPIPENHPRDPQSFYALSKFCGEVSCEIYSQKYGLDVSVARLFSVYGPRSPSHLVTSRIFSQLKNKKIVLGNTSSSRDFVYIDDVINALKIIMKKTKGFNVFNVGSGKSHSINSVLRMAQKVSKTASTLQSSKSYSRKNDIKKITADISKMKKLGWTPRIDLKTGIKFTLEYLKTI